MQKDVLSKLKEIAGESNYFDSPEDKIVYSYDGTPLFEKLPEAVIFPQNEQQISDIVKLANEEKFAVIPRGAGTGLSGGTVPTDDSVVLVLTKWNKIIEIDQANLTATVQPGVVTGQLQDEIEKLGIFYPPDPGSRNVCTIGGNIAENAGGLRGLKYGVTKDYVLGLEAVLPNGDIIKTGGKNVKDVAGYNLKDFLVGSEGTLAIFTKAILKLLPKPTSFITMIGYFDKLGDSGKAVSDIIGAHIVPSMLEFMDNVTINCIEDYAKIGLPRNIEAILLIEVDGRGSIVEEEAQKVMEILKKNNASFVKKAETVEESENLKAARRAAFSALARRRPTTILEDATVPRSELQTMIEKVQEAAKKFNVTFGNFGHAGDGNLHPTCLTDERDKDELKRAHQAFEFIFDEAIKLGGTITGEHGTGLGKKPFLEKVAGIEGIELMRTIRKAVDPNGILNPGKIFSAKPKNAGYLPDTRDEIKDFNTLFK